MSPRKQAVLKGPSFWYAYCFLSASVMTGDFLATPQAYRVQKTLQRHVSFRGVGLHSGVETKIELIPAGPDQGILFERSDLEKRAPVRAHYDSVVDTSLATSIGLKDCRETRIGTVEHLLAALYGLGVTNLLVRVDGPEIPILDGSAAPFLEGILDAGLELQPYTATRLRVLKPIKVYQNEAVAELLPRDRLRLTTSIDFPHPCIGLQTFALELTPRAFEQEVGRARTFGFLSDFEKLKRAKLARGASLENVLAFSESEVINAEGVRFADECVRHKLLDALGDLALCGAWIEGEMVSFRGGHSIHLALLKALKEQPTHWELVPPSPLSSNVQHLSAERRKEARVRV